MKLSVIIILAVVGTPCLAAGDLSTYFFRWEVAQNGVSWQSGFGRFSAISGLTQRHGGTVPFLTEQCERLGASTKSRRNVLVRAFEGVEFTISETDENGDVEVFTKVIDQPDPVTSLPAPKSSLGCRNIPPPAPKVYEHQVKRKLGNLSLEGVEIGGGFALSWSIKHVSG